MADQQVPAEADDENDADDRIECPMCNKKVFWQIFNYHLPYCRLRMGSQQQIFICPFNSLHAVTASERAHHLETCPDRGQYDFVLNPEFSPAPVVICDGRINAIVPQIEALEIPVTDQNAFNSFPPSSPVWLDLHELSFYDDESMEQ